MATKTTFVFDCCFREADSNLGWAHVTVNGASDGKQLMPNVDRDLRAICWSRSRRCLRKCRKRLRSGEICLRKPRISENVCAREDRAGCADRRDASDLPPKGTFQRVAYFL